MDMTAPVNCVPVLIDCYGGVSVLISPVRLHGDGGHKTVLVIQERCSVLVHVMRIRDFPVFINGKLDILAVSVALGGFLLVVAVRGAAGQNVFHHMWLVP